MKALCCLLAMAFAGVADAALPADPLGSPNWGLLGQTLFGDAPVRFDARVKLVIPGIAEDQHEFPIEVDARAVPGAQRILIFADLNPIPLAIDFTPGQSAPFIATRIKLDQRTPVRGAVQLKDGSWLVAGEWVDAAGGGCSAPPLSRVKGDWAQHLGEIRGIARAEAGMTRIHLAFRHPMDTGFVANIATYNLQTVSLKSADGADLGTVSIEASVGEDPALTLIAPVKVGEEVTVTGRDTNGIDYAAALKAVTAAGAQP